MTGFKDGASDDPFGENEDDADDTTGGGEADTSRSTGAEEAVSSEDSADVDESGGSDSAPSGGLPWLYARSSITDGREQTVQLHLQSSTLDVQRTARADVETRLGESVKKADLREAALLVGLSHVDEVAAQLREWGYDVDSESQTHA